MRPEERDYPAALDPEIRRLIEPKLKQKKRFFSTGLSFPTLANPSLEHQLRQSLGDEAVAKLLLKAKKLNQSLQQQVEAIKHGQKVE